MRQMSVQVHQLTFPGRPRLASFLLIVRGRMRNPPDVSIIKIILKYNQSVLSFLVTEMIEISFESVLSSVCDDCDIS